uniref:F-box domain-containing protein n=1 Tax=Aegilops tauschii subsp. strangulata TaxID=200361 RepID=A0A453KLU7_AEGTS
MANKKDKRFSDSTAMVRKRSPPRPTTLHEVPDKLLELILLHLSSPLWLIHAAATCKRWRRIIVDRRFLCNISNSDPSSVVAGDYHNHASPVDGRRHVFVPSSPALAVGSRHFSLDFLPAGGGTSWEIIDSCYSLLLLAKKKTGWRRHCLPDLLVCEPVTQRYRLIPRMEHMKYERCLTVFLHGCHSRGATTRRGHTIDVMLKFKVICVLHREYTRIYI